MTSFSCSTEKLKNESSRCSKGKNTISRFLGFKIFLFIFVSTFFGIKTSFADVHSVENIPQKAKGDRLSLSDVNSILGTIRGFFFDDSTGFVGVGTDLPTAPLEVQNVHTRTAVGSNLHINHDFFIHNADTSSDTGVVSIGFGKSTSDAISNGAIAIFSESSGNSRMGFFTEN